MESHLEAFDCHLAAVNKHEPTVRALISWDEAAARERAEEAGSGPLAGWAVGVKDILDVKGLPTRCGTSFLPETPAEGNAAVIDLLESLGAYVFCKVATTVFAYFDPGPTTNPWNSEHTAGGSSMGSAAAVAAGMVRLGVGSQTVGSVGRPASFCGVVGFKPTYERMPQEGLFPFSPSVDTVGFFTSNLADMQVACAAFFNEPEVSEPAPLRIGVIEDMRCERADAEMLGALREVAEKLEGAGCDVRPVRLPQALKDTHENHRTLIAGELAMAHREWFGRYQPHYPSKLREFIREGQQVSTEQLEQCLRRRAELQDELKKLFDEFDLLLTPSAPGAAPKGLASTGDPRMNLIFSHTRVPALTMPAQLNRAGLPLGVQFAGPRMQDMTLLAACLQIEDAIGFDERLPQ